MTTVQRRRGLPARIYFSTVQTDSMGNELIVLDESTFVDTKAWIFAQRSAKAEVPGQQHINIIRIGIDIDVTGVNLQCQVEILGSRWDVVSPPSYHHGTRHTRHWSIDLRERP